MLKLTRHHIRSVSDCEDVLLKQLCVILNLTVDEGKKKNIYFLLLSFSVSFPTRELIIYVAHYIKIILKKLNTL